ncbi:MFS transporter [Fluviispira vulneris]|uniref:MFS transporter n=1 Tax=Fluviispira vulneris TaxID=2763012 RepID=UPI00164647DD|nr:MFS transporter [Fluviispira vulneris]
MRYLNLAINELDLYLDYTVFSIMAIYVLSSNSLEIGIMGTCFTAPQIIFSKTIGKAADKKATHNIRIISFSFMLIAMLLSLYIANIFFLCSIVFLKNIGRFGNSVTVSKMLLPTETSAQFYEKYGYIVNSSRICMPILCVLLYNNIGLSSLLYLSIFLNLIGLYTSIRMNVVEKSVQLAKADCAKSNGADTKISNDRLLLFAITCLILSSLSLYLSNDLISFLFMSFGASETSIGVLISVLGLGGIMGVRIAKFLFHSLSPEKVMLLALLMNSISFFLFGYATQSWPISPLLAFYVAMGFTGLASSILSLSFKTILQDRIPFARIGRATAKIQTIAAIVATTLPFLGGALAKFTNIQMPFKVSFLFFASVLCCTTFIINFYKNLLINKNQVINNY